MPRHSLPVISSSPMLSYGPQLSLPTLPASSLREARRFGFVDGGKVAVME